MSPKKNAVLKMINLQTELLELFDKKFNLYEKSVMKHGPIGTLVLTNDKIQELISITNSDISISSNDDFLRDKLIDLYSYSAIAIMLIEKKTQKISRDEFDNLNFFDYFEP